MAPAPRRGFSRPPHHMPLAWSVPLLIEEQAAQAAFVAPAPRRGFSRPPFTPAATSARPPRLHQWLATIRANASQQAAAAITCAFNTRPSLRTLARAAIIIRASLQKRVTSSCVVRLSGMLTLISATAATYAARRSVWGSVAITLAAERQS